MLVYQPILSLLAEFPEPHGIPDIQCWMRGDCLYFQQ